MRSEQAVHHLSVASDPVRPLTVTVIMPAQDEAQTVAEMVGRCRPYATEILVVDGHSRDGTRELAEAAGARVLLDHGRGKGDAMRVGIEHAQGDVIVFIDADGSHDADDIPRLLEPLARGDADLVIGSRSRGGSDELFADVPQIMRMFGSAIITVGINYRFRVRLSDTQNGFRAIRTSVARRLGLVEDITTIEQEMVMKALHLGVRIAEVPSHEYARPYGQSRILLRNVWGRYVVSWLKYLAVRPPRNG